MLRFRIRFRVALRAKPQTRKVLSEGKDVTRYELKNRRVFKTDGVNRDTGSKT